jgi:hypothetical protein
MPRSEWGSGNPADNWQTINGSRHVADPTQNYVNYGFGRVPIGQPPPLTGLGGAGSSNVTAAPTPPHLIFTFDTIGQIIYRSIGHCRLPLRTIWASGINASGDTLDASTISFAAALCAPIDPLEEGEIFGVWDGGAQVFNSGGVITPAGWSSTDAAALTASLESVVIFPGDEAQQPASLIVADKGADKTNAFRGIRYIIFQNYPVRTGNGVPQLSIGWQRTNDGGSPAEDSGGGVEFEAGLG